MFEHSWIELRDAGEKNSVDVSDLGKEFPFPALDHLPNKRTQKHDDITPALNHLHVSLFLEEQPIAYGHEISKTLLASMLPATGKKDSKINFIEAGIVDIQKKLAENGAKTTTPTFEIYISKKTLDDGKPTTDSYDIRVVVSISTISGPDGLILANNTPIKTQTFFEVGPEKIKISDYITTLNTEAMVLLPTFFSQAEDNIKKKCKELKPTLTISKDAKKLGNWLVTAEENNTKELHEKIKATNAELKEKHAPTWIDQASHLLLLQIPRGKINQNPAAIAGYIKPDAPEIGEVHQWITEKSVNQKSNQEDKELAAIVLYAKNINYFKGKNNLFHRDAMATHTKIFEKNNPTETILSFINTAMELEMERQTILEILLARKPNNSVKNLARLNKLAEDIHVLSDLCALLALADDRANKEALTNISGAQDKARSYKDNCTLLYDKLAATYSTKAIEDIINEANTLSPESSYRKKIMDAAFGRLIGEYCGPESAETLRPLLQKLPTTLPYTCLTMFMQGRANDLDANLRHHHGYSVWKIWEPAERLLALHEIIHSYLTLANHPANEHKGPALKAAFHFLIDAKKLGPTDDIWKEKFLPLIEELQKTMINADTAAKNFVRDQVCVDDINDSSLAAVYLRSFALTENSTPELVTQFCETSAQFIHQSQPAKKAMFYAIVCEVFTSYDKSTAEHFRGLDGSDKNVRLFLELFSNTHKKLSKDNVACFFPQHTDAQSAEAWLNSLNGELFWHQFNQWFPLFKTPAERNRLFLLVMEKVAPEQKLLWEALSKHPDDLYYQACVYEAYETTPLKTTLEKLFPQYLEKRTEFQERFRPATPTGAESRRASSSTEASIAPPADKKGKKEKPRDISIGRHEGTTRTRTTLQLDYEKKLAGLFEKSAQMILVAEGKAACKIIADVLEEAINKGEEGSLPHPYRIRPRTLAQLYRALTTAYGPQDQPRQTLIHLFLELALHDHASYYNAAEALISTTSNLLFTQKLYLLYLINKPTKEPEKEFEKNLLKKMDNSRSDILDLLIILALKTKNSRTKIQAIERILKSLSPEETCLEATAIPHLNETKKLFNNSESKIDLTAVARLYQEITQLYEKAKKQNPIITPRIIASRYSFATRLNEEIDLGSSIFTAFDITARSVASVMEILDWLDRESTKSEDKLYQRQAHQAMDLYISDQIHKDPTLETALLIQITKAWDALAQIKSEEIKTSADMNEATLQAIRASKKTTAQEAASRLLRWFKRGLDTVQIHESGENKLQELSALVSNRDLILAYTLELYDLSVSQESIHTKEKEELGTHRHLGETSDNQWKELLPKLGPAFKLALTMKEDNFNGHQLLNAMIGLIKRTRKSNDVEAVNNHAQLFEALTAMSQYNQQKTATTPNNQQKTATTPTPQTLVILGLKDFDAAKKVVLGCLIKAHIETLLQEDALPAPETDDSSKKQVRKQRKDFTPSAEFKANAAKELLFLLTDSNAELYLKPGTKINSFKTSLTQYHQSLSALVAIEKQLSNTQNDQRIADLTSSKATKNQAIISQHQRVVTSLLGGPDLGAGNSSAAFSHETGRTRSATTGGPGPSTATEKTTRPRSETTAKKI